MRIQEIFTNTIQGEGFWTGFGVDFIRLWGCPVGCRWCDTGYANGGKDIPFVEMTIEDIVKSVRSDRLVISGGEPFLQKDLPSLTLALANKSVSIETSGIYYQELPFSVWVTLSPKTHLTGKAVSPEFWDRADELKIVIESVSDFDYYLPVIYKHYWQDRNVCVQPCDRDNIPISEAIKPCLEVVNRYDWVRVSVQLHKLLGLQ